MKSRWFGTVLVGVASFLAGSQTMRAQQGPPNGVPAHMVVTAEAHKGSELPAINREDVMVMEGHDRDTVVDWVPATGEHAAMELFVLLDDGANISLGSQLDEIKKFILAQPESTKIGVAYMQDGAARVAQQLTNDHDLAAKALRLPLGARGVNASPYFSVSDLVKRWPATSARREIFVASDGIDLYYGSGSMDNPYVDAAVEDAQKAGVIVYGIYTPGVGHMGHSRWLTNWGQMYLAQLAEQTGGEAYYIGFNGPAVSFSPFLDEMSDHFAHQYLLTFVPKPQKKAGAQKVKVRTEIPHVDLTAADHVYVSKPK